MDTHATTIASVDWIHSSKKLLLHLTDAVFTHFVRSDLCSRMDVKEISAKLEEFKQKAATCSTNKEKRILYSDIELLVVKIESTKDISKEVTDLKQQLSDVSAGIQLSYVNRKCSLPMKIINKIDEVVRLVAVWLILAVSSVLFAIPCILLSPVDFVLVHMGVISVYYQLSVLAKLFLARSILHCSGINVVMKGVKKENFGKNCVLACFSHGSSMDAFLLTAAIPVTALTVCKSELFLIPYFSWHISAFGGVPVNRGNREQAVKSMEAAAFAAKLGECMAISPEGTRSKSGQLISFKKGPFHLWEQLQTPIIPIVTMGAFELYPPGCSMSHPGRVYMYFLDPIYPHEASSRDEMSALVRTRMLEAMKNVPDDVAAELTWRQRLVCWLNLSVVYGISWYLYKYVPYENILTTFNITLFQAWAAVGIISAVVTLLFYTYAVYCAPIVRNLYSKTRDTVNTVKSQLKKD